MTEPPSRTGGYDLEENRVAPDDWIDVAPRGTLTKATVYLQGGSVSSVWDVSSKREVEDVAARYAIARSQIQYAEGSFQEPLQAS